MSTLVYLVFLGVIVALNAFPSDDYQYYHPGTVMLGGYYGIPPMRYPNFATRNREASPVASEEEFEKEAVTEDAVSVPDEEKEIQEDPTLAPRIASPKSKNIPKQVTPKKTKSKVKPEDEDEGSNFPLGAPGGSSLFNTFFPIMVGGNSGVRRKSGEDGGSSGGATAIANSFSTGRGGVASSHATSFGDVYLSSDLKNKNNRIRNNE